MSGRVALHAHGAQVGRFAEGAERPDHGGLRGRPQEGDVRLFVVLLLLLAVVILGSLRRKPNSVFTVSRSTVSGDRTHAVASVWCLRPHSLSLRLSLCGSLTLSSRVFSRSRQHHRGVQLNNLTLAQAVQARTRALTSPNPCHRTRTPTVTGTAASSHSPPYLPTSEPPPAPPPVFAVTAQRLPAGDPISEPPGNPQSVPCGQPTCGGRCHLHVPHAPVVSAPSLVPVKFDSTCAARARRRNSDKASAEWE